MISQKITDQNNQLISSVNHETETETDITKIDQ